MHVFEWIRSARHVPFHQAPQLNLGSLEDRLLLSTIIWVNRGSAASDSDQFNKVFGGNAAAARAVVDSVLSLWQSIIQNFNFADGSNTLSLTISENPSSWGNGAATWAGTQTDGRGKPEAGRIEIDAGSDGHGGGFYLDANPISTAFGPLFNPYAAAATSGSGAANEGDLFSVVGHEVLHTLGFSFVPFLAFRQSAYLRNTGQPDAVDRPGTLYTFNAPDVQALLTSDDGDATDMGAAEHTARVGNWYTDPSTHVTYTGTVDAVNPVYSYGRRMLPSLMDALILKDAYGYTIRTPPSFWGSVTSRSIVTGATAGGAPVVQVSDGLTGAAQFSFYAYDPGFTGGVRVAVADLYHRGVPDIITAPGPGGSPDIRIYDGATGQLVMEFMAYDVRFQGGVNIAVGDVNGDSYPDLITGAAAGNPDVRVYNGRAFASGTFSAANPGASLLAQFFAYSLQFDVGVNVAAGDINHDGYADIVTGATAGNPHVKVYNGRDIALGRFNDSNPDASLLAQFFAYGLQFNVGANVAVGDINGDGYADVVTGATAGNPDVRVYSGRAIAAGAVSNLTADGALIARFFAYGLQFNVGANIAVADLESDGFADIITGASAGNPHVKVYRGRALAVGTFNNANPDASLVDQFFASSQMGGGVTVGAR
jgi:hypothetical protein